MDSIWIKPISWSVINSQDYTPQVQLFGYTIDNKSIYVRINHISDTIIEYDEPIDRNELEKAKNDLLNRQSDGSIESTNISRFFNNVLIITGDNELTSQEFDENDSKRDPFGVLATFFRQHKIITYQWLRIHNPSISNAKVVSDLKFWVTRNNIDTKVTKDMPLNTSKHKILFWDLETYTDRGEFTNPNIDPITLISAVYSDGISDAEGFLFTRLKMDDISDRFDMKITVVYRSSEKEIIEEFLQLWKDKLPDRSVTYNGSTYDIPYLIKRMKKLGISEVPMGKIPSPSRVISVSVPTIMGPRSQKTFSHIGVEEIDLLLYFRLRYPHFPNHKLYTIGVRLLGVGKSGLEIEEMFRIFKEGTPTEMAEAGYYSMTDSILLHKLYYGEDNSNMINKSVEYDLEDLCNKLGVTAVQLLNSSPDEIVKIFGYTIEAGSIFRNISKKEEDNYIIKSEYRAYRNVYSYDYSNLLIEAMSRSSDSLTVRVAKFAKDTGIRISTALWGSNFTSKNIRFIQNYLDKYDGIIVDVNKINIVTLDKIDDELFQLEESYQLYAILSGNSRFIVSDDEVSCHGRSLVCRPIMTLEEEIIDQWAVSLIDDIYFEKPVIYEDTDVSKLVRRIKISVDDETSNVDLKKQLYKLVKPITTFKRVEYVYGKEGVELYKDQKIEDLDIDLYYDNIMKIYEYLNKIKLYQ